MEKSLANSSGVSWVAKRGSVLSIVCQRGKVIVSIKAATVPYWVALISSGMVE